MYELLEFEVKERCYVIPEEVAKLEFYYKENEDEGGLKDLKLDVRDGVLYDLELDDYYDTFPHIKEFAKRLSKAIKSGKVEIYMKPDPNVGSPYGFRITPNKVEYIYPVWMSEEDLEVLEGVL